MSFLSLAGLEKTYPDGTQAVRGIDLAITEGEFVVLLGPSGCGKTTTLRMIAGLEAASGGSITLGGEDVTALRPSHRDIGFVFQFYALYPKMSVADNIGFPLRAAGVPKAERRERVRAVAERLGITSLLDRRPGQLAGGDQQRVSLGRAMIRRPRIWLMDEPLGTLDADRRQEMAEYIREQQLASKVTTIYVTHDQEEAMSLADRIVVMQGGRIQQLGRPEEIYDRPANLFVAHFIGSPGMNQLRGELVEGHELRVGEARLTLELDAERRAGLRGCDELTVGLRPEFLQVASDGPVEATVVLDEYLGACRYLHCESAFGRLVVRTGAGQPGRVGESVRLQPDWRHLRLFAGPTGEAVA